MDPATCYLLAALLTVLNGGVLGLVHRDLPASMRASATDWRISTLLMAGGCVLFVAQLLGHAKALVPIGNLLMLLACTGYWRALRRFDGHPDRTALLLVPAAVGIATVTVFAVVWPSLVVRVVLASLVMTVQLLGCASTLRASSRSERAVARRVLIGIFVVLAAFLVFRAGYFVVAGTSASSMVDPSHAINLVTPLLAAALPVIGTTAYILMCQERIARSWERAASTDYLTGLANRRTLGDEGARRLEEARRRGEQLALAVVDVDHFKSINDRFGHDVGDLALRHVAAALQRACRGGDLPARQGGEEFVILFDRISPDQATLAGERLRTAVAASPFVNDAATLPITVSIGVAALTSTDQNLDDLLRRADLALYAAKAGGRNRVELAT